MSDISGFHFALMGGNLLAGTAVGWVMRSMKFERLRRNNPTRKPDVSDAVDILTEVSKTTSDCTADLQSLDIRVLSDEEESDETLLSDIRLLGQNYSDDLEDDVPRLTRLAVHGESILQHIVTELILHTQSVDRFNKKIITETEHCLSSDFRKALSLTISELLQSNRQLQTQLINARRELDWQRNELDTARRDARIDTLTKLFNRRGFEERLRAAHENFLRGREGFAVVLFDLDKFKSVNDTYGHAAGDIVLQVFAKVLQDTVRASDAAARVGGEEFALLLEHTSAKDALMMADRIRRQAAQKIVRIANQSVRFNVSGGVATVTDNDTPARVMSRADAALYRAKQTGRDRVQLYDLDCTDNVAKPRSAVVGV